MRIRVTLDLKLPNRGQRPEDVDEWIRYNLYTSGYISIDNPLYKVDLEPVCDSIEWEEVRGQRNDRMPSAAGSKTG